MTEALNLPPFPYRLSDVKGKTHIYDEFRKKFVVYTPEEWVRQHILHYLVNKKNYMPGLIAIERKVKALGTQINRFDILCYNRYGQPHLLVECKAAHVPIGHDTFMQTAHYNKSVRASYIAVSNGLIHYAAKANFDENELKFLDDFPNFT